MVVIWFYMAWTGTPLTQENCPSSVAEPEKELRREGGGGGGQHMNFSSGGGGTN